jgi:hypothetical protein
MVRRSPAKFAAVAGGTAFVVVGGPRRVLRRARRAVFGKPAPMPDSMLPDEIEKTLRYLGDDGTKVRGALERDFAAYAKQASRDRTRLRTLLLLSVARPLLAGATKAASRWLFRPDEERFEARLNQIRERTRRQSGDEPAPEGGHDGP